MEEMKEKAQKLILGDDLDEKEKNVSVNASNADEGYFNTYSHFAIHHEMLTVSLYGINSIDRVYLIKIYNIIHNIIFILQFIILIL